jgi:acyl-CoA thioesterase FadM
MLAYFLRLIVLRLGAKRRPAAEPLGPIRTPMRVWLGEIDMNRHLNNGAYLKLLDFGRYDLLIRSGLFQKVVDAGWFPVVSAETIQFIRSLKWRDRFEIETEIIGWTEQDFFMRQTFWHNERVMAEAIVKGRFLSRKGSIPVAKFIELAGREGLESPELPEWIRQWDAAQATERRRLKRAVPGWGGPKSAG